MEGGVAGVDTCRYVQRQELNLPRAAGLEKVCERVIVLRREEERGRREWDCVGGLEE
jgi:hypothetical protein